MSNLFDSFGSSKAAQHDDKISKKVPLSYGQVSVPLVTSGSGSAVNSLVFYSPNRPEKSDSSNAVTRSESEQVIEIDTLKQFTIPKKRKARKGMN